jgi:hypothetical protein
LKRQVNIAIINKGALSGVILVLLRYCSEYIIFVLPLLAKYFCLHTILYMEYCKWYHSSFQGMTCGVIFFRVEIYSDVFKLQRYVVARINLWLGSHTHMKYKWFLSAHLLDTLVTPVGTP